jgi:hypothetical protein
MHLFMSLSLLHALTFSARANPTFPACGTVATLQNKTYTLRNAGRASCQPLTVHGRQIDPKSWYIVEFCACRLYTWVPEFQREEGKEERTDIEQWERDGEAV